MKNILDEILSRQVKTMATLAFQLNGKSDVYDRVWGLWIIIFSIININIWILLGEPKFNVYLLIIIIVGIPHLILYPLRKYLNKFDTSPLRINNKRKMYLRLKLLILWILFVSISLYLSFTFSLK